MRYWWVNDYMDCDKDYLAFGYNDVGRGKRYGALTGENGDLFIKYHSTNKSKNYDYKVPKKTIYAIGKIIDDSEDIKPNINDDFYRQVKVQYLEKPIKVDTNFLKGIQNKQNNFKDYTGKEFKIHKTKKENSFSPPIDFFTELSPDSFKLILDNISETNKIDVWCNIAGFSKIVRLPINKPTIPKISNNENEFIKDGNHDETNAPYNVDPQKRLELTEIHKKIIRQIYRYLKNKAIRVIDNKGLFKDYDLVAFNESKYLLFEVKSINKDSLNDQMKKAFGQILIYKDELENLNKIILPLIAINNVNRDVNYSKFKEIFLKYGIEIIECPKDFYKIDALIDQKV